MTLIDIVGSIIIGGIVLVMVLAFDGNLVQGAGVQTVRVMAQSNLTELTGTIETDFRRLGFRVKSFPDTSVLYADSLRVQFRGDVNNDGTVDTITYEFDTSASGAANKNTHIVYRTRNSQARVPIKLGVTKLRFWYYDSSGTVMKTNPVTYPSKIKAFRVALNIESLEPYKQTTMPYLKLNPGVYWERMFKPQNMR